MTTEETGRVTISLSHDEALVLFEWLASFNQGQHDFEDQAEQRVLWDLEAMLESSLREPLRPAYSDRLAEAGARIRDSMG